MCVHGSKLCYMAFYTVVNQGGQPKRSVWLHLLIGITLRHQNEIVQYSSEPFWQSLGIYTVDHLALHAALK